MQSSEDRPPGHLRHLGDRERDIATGLTTWCVDEPQMRAVHQQTDGYPRFPQQPFTLRLRTGVPVALAGGHRGIEIRAYGEALDEHEPRCLPCLRGELPDTVGGPQRLVILRQGDLECRKILGKRRHVGNWCEVCRLPAEHCLGKRCEVTYLWDDVVIPILWQAGQKSLMLRGDVPVDVGLGRQQCRDRDHQPHRLNISEPFEMRQVFRVLRHGVTLS